ncbi:MAG: TolC family protein [Bacteroidetes bacterium]|uniref:TolC family protein n=1 Tax=Candidatus Caccoplasma merdipullorum TaxID=2840718 RepID=A0A9D9E600_9BACT|nr:TolC family protein [Candidatus Caccoplasma merdipullorum]
MKKVIQATAILLVLFAATPSAAITIDECRRMATENYPMVKQYGLVEMSTDYSISNAKRNYLPRISISAQATYQSEVVEFSPEIQNMFSTFGVNYAGIDKDQYRATIELQQNIWDGGISKAQRKKAEAEGTSSARSIETEIYSVNERIDQLYFGILILKARQEQNIKLRELLKSNCDKIEGMLRNGTATQSDYDAVRAEQLAAEQDYRRITASCKAYCNMLSLFTGKEITPDTEFILPEAIYDPDAENRRPELSLIDARISELDAEEFALKRASNPKIGAFAQGFYGNTGLNMFKDMMEHRWSANYIVGIKLQWDISQYYTRRNTKNKITLARQQLQNNKETFLFNSNIKKKEIEGEIDKMHEIMRKDDEIIKLRRAVREAAESKYRNGVIYISDLLREITLENNAEINGKLNRIELAKEIYRLKTTLNN